jgi:hypothetical protein
MNDSKELAHAQTVLNYFKNRSYELEYQFVVYRTKTEEMVNRLQSEKNVLQEYIKKLESEKRASKKSNAEVAKIKKTGSIDNKK